MAAKKSKKWRRENRRKLGARRKRLARKSSVIGAGENGRDVAVSVNKLKKKHRRNHDGEKGGAVGNESEEK
jgi:hypothetical protein